ncbi:hypothetical protein QTP88_023940 [Uroleucon formosanum]
MLQTISSDTEFTQIVYKFIIQMMNDPETKDFGVYFERMYVNRATLWAYCYRKGLGVNCNVHLESMHKTIKYRYLNGCRIGRMDKSIMTIRLFTRDKKVERMIKLSKGKSTTRIQKIKKRHITSISLNLKITKNESNGWNVDINKIHLIEDSEQLKKAIKKIDALNAFIDATSKQSAPNKAAMNSIKNNLESNLVKTPSGQDLCDGFDRFRNTVVKQKHIVEEQEKKFGPIINALKNVNTTMKEVKDVAIKTEGDIQKLNIPYYYQPRNPELKRLISSEETIGTPKHSHQKSTTNSPLPKRVINLDKIHRAYKSNKDVTIQLNSNQIDTGEYKFSFDIQQITILKNTKKNNTGVILELQHKPKQIKKGGFLPIGIAAITTAIALAEGVSAVISAVTDAQHKKRIE